MTLDDVPAARRSLGRWGLYLPAALDTVAPVSSQVAAVRRLEAAGCPTVWVNESVGGKDALVQLALLLGATERTTFGTGIANIWARPAQTMHAAAAMLAQAHPGRLVLGLGVGYESQAASVSREFGPPLATMRTYLEAMIGPAVDGRYARIVAANGPGMLHLAATAADGALPTMQPTSATAEARRMLGPDRLLVVMQRLDPDPATTADALGSITAHLDAGADHVVLGQPLGGDFDAGVDRAVQAAGAFAAALATAGPDDRSYIST